MFQSYFLLFIPNIYISLFQATEHLRAFIEDCDRRTELAKKRLAETQEELSAEVSSKAEKVHELSETIGKKLAQAEEAGAEGKVEESIKFMEEVEDIRKKKVAGGFKIDMKNMGYVRSGSMGSCEPMDFQNFL